MASLTPEERARYSRHLLLPEIGVAGQEKIRNARVLVVGAGGLGSPTSLYLAAAGVGTIGIADFDHVESHNLQRQILYGEADIGLPKVVSASVRLRQINQYADVVEHPEGVTATNAVELFSRYDIVVDGTDNFAVRYLINDAAVMARRPLVYGSVFKFEGRVTVFTPDRGGPCYRCVFPKPPDPDSIPGCGEAGVIGALCGIIGSWQALETIKIITGCGTNLAGRMIVYDALNHETQTITLSRRPKCEACGDNASRTLNEADYTFRCDHKSAKTLPKNMTDSHPIEISVHDARRILMNDPDGALLIDVREPHEVDICKIGNSQHIPLRQLPEALATLPTDKHILIHCHHGGRSMRATEFLRARGFAATSNIAGGIDAWAEEIDPSMRRY